jgi:hypothetical protein
MEKVNITIDYFKRKKHRRGGVAGMVYISGRIAQALFCEGRREAEIACKHYLAVSAGEAGRAWLATIRGENETGN